MRVLVLLLVLCSSAMAVEVGNVSVLKGKVLVDGRNYGKIQAGSVYVKGARVGKFHGGKFHCRDGSVLATMTPGGLVVGAKIYKIHGQKVFLGGRPVYSIRYDGSDIEVSMAILVAGGHL